MGYNGRVSLVEDLKHIVRGEVDSDPVVLDTYSRDASLFVVRPQVVVRPIDAEDVCRVVRYVREARQHAPSDARTLPSITPRSAGTDMSGGPLGNSIVLDMVTHLNKFIAMEGNVAIVEPGIYFRDFDKETKRRKLELPSYTASRELNTIGGMVANNSGGEKNLKYGKTARYVEALDVVLADGAVHTLQNLSGDQFAAKLKEQSYEGDVYRRMAALVSDERNRTIIKEHTPKVEKNSAGYALWDIGDGIQSLNLARLMVGAQGTLGVITKVRCGLVPPKPYAAMTVLFLKNLSELGPLVPRILKHKPDSFESYDDHTFSLGVKYFPEFAVHMKSGLFRLGIDFLPEMFMMVTGGVPKLVLLVEFREDDQTTATKRARALALEIQKEFNVKIRVAPTENAARKYWVVRRESFNLLRKKVRGKRTAPFIDDFVVPPETMPEFLPKLETILSRYHLTYTVAGHVGDGNFHIIPLVDPNDPGMVHLIDELSHRVYDLVLSYNGSITGEHNDGLVRTPYVEKMFGKEMYDLFVQVKQIFDPQNIFNPGKKVGTSFREALEHLDLSK